MARCRGQRIINGGRYSISTVLGTSSWSNIYYDISKYGELTEQQKRMLLPPSIGSRPRVVDAD